MAASSSVLFVTAQLSPDLPGTNVTSSRRHLPHLSFNTESAQLVIGIVLAVTGNLVISISLNVQKSVHNANDAKPEGERKPFTTNPMWWLGLSGTVAGEIGNFLAFGFAGADIVTPLGAVAVVSNAMIATMFLGEMFRIRDALGVLLTCLGSVLVVIKAPASDRDMSVEMFLEYLSNPIFLVYITSVICVGVGLWHVLPRVRARHPAYGLLLCSLLGTVTVLCSTALSNFIRVSVNGDSQFGSPLPYLLVLIAVPCGVGQVRFLNETMELFDNTQVVPIYYILFTLSTITGSAMLYQDFYDKAVDALVVFVLGCLLCFAGVSLLTSGRYVDDDDATQARLVRPLPVDVTDSARIDEEQVDLRRKPQRSTSTSTSLRQALRHLDSPLFGASNGRASPKLFALDSRGSSTSSLDGVYESMGRGARHSVPNVRTRRNISEPHATRVTDAPFGGGAERSMVSLTSRTRRATAEDVGQHGLAFTSWLPNAGERGPPRTADTQMRRSRSHEGSRSGGMEEGLLEDDHPNVR